MKKILLFFLMTMIISCTSDNSGALEDLVVEDYLGSDVIEIGEGSENEQTDTSDTSGDVEEQSEEGSEGEESNSQDSTQTSGLYLGANGVTLIANSAAKPGDKITFESITYLVVDDQMLRDIVMDDREDIATLVTTYVTDLSYLFENKQTITPNIAAWDVSNVTNLSYMFSGASVYNGVLSYWDTASVSLMDAVFYNASDFNQNLSGWCVSLIDKAPTNFSAGSSIPQSSLPQWGTCPD